MQHIVLQVKPNQATLVPELSDEVRRTPGADGRLLGRWSGTEPKLRIMLGGPDEARIRQWAKDLAEAAKQDTAVPA